jgi:NADPH:quinone reductase-like Zn-dependent oxidoreductase
VPAVRIVTHETWSADSVSSVAAIIGSDVSGVVEAVATDVQGFSVGDEVFGMVRFPSFGESAAYAEYVAAPASDLAKRGASFMPLLWKMRTPDAC